MAKSYLRSFKALYNEMNMLSPAMTMMMYAKLLIMFTPIPNKENNR